MLSTIAVMKKMRSAMSAIAPPAWHVGGPIAQSVSGGATGTAAPALGWGA